MFCVFLNKKNWIAALAFIRATDNSKSPRKSVNYRGIPQFIHILVRHKPWGENDFSLNKSLCQWKWMRSWWDYAQFQLKAINNWHNWVEIINSNHGWILPWIVKVSNGMWHIKWGLYLISKGGRGGFIMNCGRLKIASHHMFSSVSLWQQPNPKHKIFRTRGKPRKSSNALDELKKNVGWAFVTTYFYSQLNPSRSLINSHCVTYSVIASSANTTFSEFTRKLDDRCGAFFL